VIASGQAGRRNPTMLVRTQERYRELASGVAWETPTHQSAPGKPARPARRRRVRSDGCGRTGTGRRIGHPFVRPKGALDYLQRLLELVGRCPKQSPIGDANLPGLPARGSSHGDGHDERVVGAKPHLDHFRPARPSQEAKGPTVLLHQPRQHPCPRSATADAAWRDDRRGAPHQPSRRAYRTGRRRETGGKSQSAIA
jgi:hypothetical protein